MTTQMMVFLSVGTIAMAIPILTVVKRYDIPWWKGILLTILLTISGTYGTFLMFYIENGSYGGISFYGAVFLVPLLFVVIAPVLRIPYGDAMDLCAIGECIMLALMKVHCMIGGCCIGRTLFTLSSGIAVRFPSRSIEMISAIVLFMILLQWMIKGQKRGNLYAWYMLLYGCVRFILNIFREAWVTKEKLLPYGNVWSLVAIAIGVGCIFVIQKRQERADTKNIYE